MLYTGLGLLLLCLAEWLFFTPHSSLARSASQSGRRFNTLTILLIALIAWLAVSGVSSPLPWVSLRTLLQAIACFGILWAASRYADVSMARRAAILALAAGWINALYAIIQFADIDPLFVTTGPFPITGRGAMNAFAGNTNWLAPYLLFCLILSAALYRSAHHKVGRLTYRASMALLIVVLVLILNFATLLTLTALLAFGLGMLMILKKLRPARTLLILVLLVLIFAGLLLSLAVAGGEYRERAQKLGSVLAPDRWDYLLSGRYYAWRFTWEMILDKPLVGNGLGLFRLQEYDFRVGLFQPVPGEYIERETFLNKRFDEVHNDYLQIWAETGFVGLVLVLLALYRYGLGMWSWLSKPGGQSDCESIDAKPVRETRMLTAAWSMATLAGAINALGNFPLHVAHLAAFLAVAAGISGQLAGIWPSGPGKALRLRPFVWPRAIVLLGIAITAASAAVWETNSYRSARIRHEIAPALQTLSELRETGQSISPRSMSLAFDVLQIAPRAVNLDPWNPLNHHLLGQAYFYSHQNHRAIDSYHEALELGPDAAIYGNLAMALAEMGDRVQSRKYAQKAILIDPSQRQAREVLLRLELLEVKEMEGLPGG